MPGQCNSGLGVSGGRSLNSRALEPSFNAERKGGAPGGKHDTGAARNCCQIFDDDVFEPGLALAKFPRVAAKVFFYTGTQLPMRFDISNVQVVIRSVLLGFFFFCSLPLRPLSPPLFLDSIECFFFLLPAHISSVPSPFSPLGHAQFAVMHSPSNIVHYRRRRRKKEKEKSLPEKKKRKKKYPSPSPIQQSVVVVVVFARLRAHPTERRSRLQQMLYSEGGGDHRRQSQSPKSPSSSSSSLTPSSWVGFWGSRAAAFVILLFLLLLLLFHPERNIVGKEAFAVGGKGRERRRRKKKKINDLPSRKSDMGKF